MKKMTLMALAITLTAGISVAQNEVDALRYSNQGLYGTARYVGMGGAFGALGGDFRAISSNPASMAVFRKSIISFSPTFYYNKSETEINDQTAQDGVFNFHMGNMGFVGYFEPNHDKWKQVSISLGYNRLDDYNQSFEIRDQEATSSLLDSYVEEVNSRAFDDADDLLNAYPYNASLAYDTWLLNPDANRSTTFDHVLQNSEGFIQKKSVVRSGGMGEYLIGMGGNYNNKLYMGATIGLVKMRFHEETAHNEIVTEEDQSTDLAEYTFYEQLDARGTGLNLKFGMIYRVFYWLRLGAAVHSPTFMAVEEEWSSTMISTFDDGSIYESLSPNGSFEYTLTTPFRAMGSAALVLGKLGIISAEYEYVDYSRALLGSFNGNNSVDYDFIDENNAISNTLQAPHHIKLGAELRWDPLRIRSGLNYQSNVLAQETEDKLRQLTLSFGLGIKEKNFYTDLTYAVSPSKVTYAMYNSAEPTTLTSVKNSAILTVGFRM